MAFFLNVIATGSVLGVDSSSSPDEVTARLGDDFGENHNGAAMWRDYGTVEFFWERLPGSSGWQGRHFSVQVHWLSRDPRWMNAEVRRAYGSFRRRLRFEHLAAALMEAGCRLVEVGRPMSDVREFAYAQTGTTVLVVTAESGTSLEEGDVWQISCQNSEKLR
jgi:hypothetical protein